MMIIINVSDFKLGQDPIRTLNPLKGWKDVKHMKKLIHHRSLFTTATTLIASTAVLLACSGKQTGSMNAEDSGKGFFSNRPTKPETDPKKNFFFGLIKLKTPSLFATGKVVNGKMQVDPDQAALIEAEQAKFLAEFAVISPDVRAVYRYKYLVNGIAIYVPGEVIARLRGMSNVVDVVPAGKFARPQVEEAPAPADGRYNEKNSVKFIGAEAARGMKIKNPDGKEVAIDGTGMKVGVIDTGVDYTHKMFGGEGTEAAYKAIDPKAATPAFPNAKVVGGYDFVGTEYNAATPEGRLPVPDANPLDEADHGTHVAGSIAGIGDGVETYTGVAPGASLYALKVFGKDGSTDDPVVIAALEFSADPNGDGKLDDKLDVVNLSLGSPYGSPSATYSEAVRNLVRGGTVVVASAGNSGDFKYITGEPSSSAEAISVAAGVDDMYHNWQFNAVRLKMVEGEDVVVEAIESTLTKPLTEIGNVSGKFVHIGLADADLSDEVKAKLKGNVALIDRGVVTFQVKITRAFEAGAIGVVVVNNVPGEPMVMGGEGETKIPVPAIMIAKDLGDKIKEQMTKGDVVINFKTSDKIQRPELIDTITGFSSRGPRSMDALIKPEITGPGASIVSAKTGSGSKGVKMSGTSMSGPHVAGVMALLKQAHSTLTPAELKSMLLGRASTVVDTNKKTYPIARQGSGRVRVVESLTAPLVADKATLSLGIIPVSTVKAMRAEVTLKNISNFDVTVTGALDALSPDITMAGVVGTTIKAGATAKVVLRFMVSAANMTESVREMDGWVKFSAGNGEEVLRIPVLAVAHKVSNVVAKEFVVHSSGEADAPNSSASLKLANTGAHDAEVLAFNLLDVDARKVNERQEQFVSRACDLAAAGYRILQKEIDGRQTTVLQVAAKLYEPLTSWQACDFSVLFDANGDALPDQELAVVRRGTVTGLAAPGKDEEIIGILVDSVKAREIREAAEKAPADKDGKKKEPNYAGALIDSAGLMMYEHGTIVVIEAEVQNLTKRASGELAMIIATTHNESSVIEKDDFLGTLNDWMKISTLESSQAFMEMPESFTVKAGTEASMDLTKGFGKGNLLILMPNNPFVVSDQLLDSQAAIAQPTYSFKTP